MPHTVEFPAYATMHYRLQRHRGLAAAHSCAACGVAAQEWAYDRRDPDELQSRHGPYSTDMDHYQPMCVPCHKALDAAHRHRPTHCRHGHEYTPQNTYVHRGYLYCRACGRRRSAAYKTKRSTL